MKPHNATKDAAETGEFHLAYHQVERTIRTAEAEIRAASLCGVVDERTRHTLRLLMNYNGYHVVDAKQGIGRQPGGKFGSTSTVWPGRLSTTLPLSFGVGNSRLRTPSG